MRGARRLTSLLSGSKFEPAIMQLQRAATEVLADNKMPFFPAYTDHGEAHVEAIFEAIDELIPDDVFDCDLLGSADAAVLMGATYLHDLALHIREPGFLELIADPTLKPLPWFSSQQGDRPADRPWPDLWESYRKEARYFSKSELDRLLGPTNGVRGVPAIALGEFEPSPADWTDADRLLTGEFLRRHHARLAHEIAIYGFPGAGERFPVLAQTLPELADAIGVTARSHGENLRTASEYLNYREKGSLRPDGAAVLYLMGALRIADYFQLQADRATPLLLHLRNPQSPQSVSEWKKSQAITGVSWKQDDPLAVLIRVGPSHNLRTHLQIAELIEDLQRELDVTTAVLGERYGRSDLAALRLSRQRVQTNLHDAGLQDRLGFVPRRAALRSAEDLFRLVVGDLYGNHPAVAGRELLQNAVDAVRELAHWRTRKGFEAGARFRDLPADVLVEVEAVDDETNVLRVADRGIGMTPETVIDGFLTAGATFGVEGDRDEEVDAATASRWMKAGKFGVGVFAAFLLGAEVRVTTRHVEATRGLSFVARLDEDLVQLSWEEDAPFGTEIVVPFASSKLPEGLTGDGDSRGIRSQRLVREIGEYYGLKSPSVQCRAKRRDGGVFARQSSPDIPSPGEPLPSGWRNVETLGFDAVMWGLGAQGHRGDTPRLAHNGLFIRGVTEPPGSGVYSWRDPLAKSALRRPDIAVFDSRHTLSISLNRYRLVDQVLPFEPELLTSIGEDIVAHALVVGAAHHPLGRGHYLRPVTRGDRWAPLIPSVIDRFADEYVCVFWSTGTMSDAAALDFQGRFSRLAPAPLDFRVVIPLSLGGIATEQRRREQAAWGFNPENIEDGIISFQKVLEWDLAAAIIVRSLADRRLSLVAQEREPRWQTLSSSAHWMVLEIRPHAFRRDRESRVDRSLNETLVPLAKDLVGPMPAVSLAVFRKPKGDQARSDAIGSPWLETIDGGLPRDSRTLANQRAEVLQAVPRLRAPILAWQQSQKGASEEL